MKDQEFREQEARLDTGEANAPAKPGRTDPGKKTGAGEASAGREDRPLPDNAEGLEEERDTAIDRSRGRTADGGWEANSLPKDDSGIHTEDARFVTDEHGLAVDGGSLAGNKDDFEGEVGAGVHPVPGAGDGANEGLSNDRDQLTGNPSREEQSED
jgi:hypothetical protein